MHISKTPKCGMEHKTFTFFVFHNERLTVHIYEHWKMYKKA